jgi:LPXTG-motif cell wall-anchored protein
VRRSFLLALTLAAGILVPAAAAGPTQAAPDPGSIGIRLLDAPVSAGEDPRARTYIVDHLKPGTTIKRRVEVGNTTGAVQSVAVYAGGATIKGGSFNPTEGRTPSELTQWTEVDHATVSLKPDQRSAVEVTITVPKDASPGERYGAVWAEIAGPSPDGGGVSLVNRVGVRIYLDVGPGGAPASNFALDGLAATRAADGSPSVVAQVRNTGGRALDLSGELTLTDGPGGLNAGPFPATLGVTLAPGDSSPVTVLLDRQIPDGPWQAALTLRSGLLEKTTKATLTFPSGEGSIEATVPATGGFAWWLAILGGALLGLGLIFLLLLFRRRRSDEDAPAEPPSHRRSDRHRALVTRL